VPDDRTPVITAHRLGVPPGELASPRRRRSAGGLRLDDLTGGTSGSYYQTPIPSWASSPTLRTNKEAREKKAAEERKKHASDSRIADARRLGAAQRVYVDGRMAVEYHLYDADGKPVTITTLGGVRTDGKTEAIPGDDTDPLTPGQRSEYETAKKNRNDTFSILGINDVPGDTAFIMSKGAPLNSQGQSFYETERGKAIAEDNLVKHRPNTDAQGRPLNNTNPTATNMMTVAGGVTWFRALSQKDPAAYDQLVQMLVDAKYLPKETARKGIYTLDAGKAFAYAAADAAQNAEAGGTDDLRTFLGKVASSATAADDSDNYKPMDRSYTDPAALAQGGPRRRAGGARPGPHPRGGGQVRGPLPWAGGRLLRPGRRGRARQDGRPHRRPGRVRGRSTPTSGPRSSTRTGPSRCSGATWMR
jgi:hypothetical protein